MMEIAERNLFPKSERLSLKNDIDRLFDKGQSFIAFPLRIVYLSDIAENPAVSGISILISVPKKRIKHAVDRNRIKRLIRENFRLQKSSLVDFGKGGKRLHIAFMYVCNEVRPYADIEKAMTKAIHTILQKESA